MWRSAPAGAAYDRSDWSSAFRNVGVELNAVPLVAARGTIPSELAGTLYRNGPGRLERGGHWVHHPFDGDGMITALRFEAGSLQLSNRFVRTEGWLAEEAADKAELRRQHDAQLRLLRSQHLSQAAAPDIEASLNRAAIEP